MNWKNTWNHIFQKNVDSILVKVPILVGKWVLGKLAGSTWWRLESRVYFKEPTLIKKALFIKCPNHAHARELMVVHGWLYICLHKTIFLWKKCCFTFIAGILATFLLSSALTAQNTAPDLSCRIGRCRANSHGEYQRARLDNLDVQSGKNQSDGHRIDG